MRPRRVLLFTAAVMLLVELVQGATVTGRAFGVDDVLLNTTGVLIGHLLPGRRPGRARAAAARLRPAAGVEGAAGVRGDVRVLSAWSR